MCTSGTAPPSGVKLSWAEFTAPVDVPVVLAAKRPEAAAPKRTSAKKPTTTATKRRSVTGSVYPSAAARGGTLTELLRGPSGS
jgi:hypothetical protein